MTHKKKSNTGRMIAVGIVILGGILYSVSSSNLFTKNKNTGSTTAASSYSCPMMKNTQGGGGCGGSRTTTPTTNTTAAQTATNPATNYETVNVGHTAFALNPQKVTLQAGKSYKLIITPTENGGGCMNTITFPGLDSNVYPVKAGEAITITINNAQAGSYNVVCGAMGMQQGTIIVQ